MEQYKFSFNDGFTSVEDMIKGVKNILQDDEDLDLIIETLTKTRKEIIYGEEIERSVLNMDRIWFERYLPKPLIIQTITYHDVFCESPECAHMLIINK